MRATNADVVAKEIADYTEEVERRLKDMVAMFAFKATEAIQENIPIGDQESINAGANQSGTPAASYYKLYEIRANNPALQIPAQAGYHRGALGYSYSGNFQFMPIVFEARDSAEQLMYDVESYYQLGDTFYIGAEGPAYDLLNENSSEQTNGQGIAKPSDEAIAAIYRTDMKSFYDLAN